MSHSSCARQVRERRAVSLLTAGLLTAAFACTEPTAPARTLNPETAALAAGGNQSVKVRIFRLSTNTLRIEGPTVSGDANIFNSGLAIPSGVSMQAVISQPAATREAANAPLACSGTPGDAGKLPTGGCDIMFAAKATNSAPGVGTLVPGPAVLVLRVVANATELASKSINVNLVATPGITTLSLVSTTLAIDGPATNYSATLQNPANSLQGVLLQGWIVQGLTRKAAGGTLVSCGSGIGVFPPGTCTINFSASASNSGSGPGTLAPGAAVFELQLVQSSGGTSTTFDTETVAITLVSSTPTIASVTLQTTTLVVGASVDYTAQLRNPGFPVTDVLLQGEMEQDQGGVTVVKGAGGTFINCGAGFAVLPTTGTGTCAIPFTVTALSNNIGGSFVSGPARFVLRLYKAVVDVPPVEYDQVIIDVTLVVPAPTIVSITPASQYVVLDAPVPPGAFTDVSVTIANPGPALSTVLVQGWIRQGSARRAAGGTVVTCATAGTLPNGECVQASVIVANNGPSSGTGTLVPGDATFELELKHFDGTVETILDTKTIPIILVASTPSIVSISLVQTSFVINGPRASFSALFYNPTGAALSGVLAQGSIDQGAASMPSGGAVLSCSGTNGEMPPGTCAFTFTMGAANNGATPALVAGPATFRLELWQNGAVLATKSVPITLTSP